MPTLSFILTVSPFCCQAKSWNTFLAIQHLDYLHFSLSSRAFPLPANPTMLRFFPNSADFDDERGSPGLVGRHFVTFWMEIIWFSS